MSNIEDENCCVICKGTFSENEKSVTVSKKGLLTLISYSEKRELLDLTEYLNERNSTSPIGKVLVHAKCRRDFTDKKRLFSSSSSSTEEPAAKKLRSSLSPFNWNDDCMFCGKHAQVDPRHPDRAQVYQVTTLHFRDKVLEWCDTRGDTWAAEVQNRLHGCIDLVAAEAIYHSNCYTMFMLNKKATPETTVKGRPEDQDMRQWFDALCNWLESEGDADLYTLSELQAKMVEFSGGADVYSIKRLKQKLEDRYKEFIFFAEIEGRSNVVCFRNMASYIINEKWYSEKKDDIQDEANRIVTAAAKIIKSAIRESKYDPKKYPTNDDIANAEQSKSWIPQHLQTLLMHIVPSKLKQSSIGHCIIQAARPRSDITPTLFGLGVEVDHVFGSKWLNN